MWEAILVLERETKLLGWKLKGSFHKMFFFLIWNKNTSCKITKLKYYHNFKVLKKQGASNHYPGNSVKHEVDCQYSLSVLDWKKVNVNAWSVSFRLVCIHFQRNSFLGIISVCPVEPCTSFQFHYLIFNKYVSRKVIWIIVISIYSPMHDQRACRRIVLSNEYHILFFRLL